MGIDGEWLRMGIFWKTGLGTAKGSLGNHWGTNGGPLKDRCWGTAEKPLWEGKTARGWLKGELPLGTAG